MDFSSQSLCIRPTDFGYKPYVHGTSISQNPYSVDPVVKPERNKQGLQRCQPLLTHMSIQGPTATLFLLALYRRCKRRTFIYARDGQK